jgi:heterogeneous nuclear rnp K-like protein 2
MSASPPTHQSVKRPLEEVSSPSRNEQPDAKRPALDKFVKEESESKSPTAHRNGESTPVAPAASENTNGTQKTNGEKSEAQDSQGDTVVPDAAENKSTANITGTAQVPAAAPSNSHDETAWIHVRSVISSPEAATIIGKGGENVSKIRQLSNAKCTVSDYQKGAVERILTVSGNVESVAKVSILPSRHFSANMIRLSVSSSEL